MSNDIVLIGCVREQKKVLNSSNTVHFAGLITVQLEIGFEPFETHGSKGGTGP